jgi:hypothetical protein
MAVVETILTSSFAVNIVYPFLLIFVLVFAILQKSKILGEGKHQIDALVSLSIALIVVAFGWATDIITKMMPFLAISLVTILVFMLLYGFIASDIKKGLEIPDWLKRVGVAFATVVVVIALIVATGQWDRIYNSIFTGEGISGLWADIILVIIVIAAASAVVLSGKSKVKKNNSED